MTREEIYIEKLSELRSKYSCFDEEEELFYHALSLGIKGIKALKAEPCGDAVSREAVINALYASGRPTELFDYITEVHGDIASLPPVTPLPDKIDGMLEDAYEHGYQQARYDYEIQPCGDAVRREAVLNTLDTMDAVLDENRTVEAYKELLKECYKELPPVTPKQRTGKWIITSFTDRYICSECGHDLITQYKPDNYCSYCGAKMIFDI